MVVEQIEHDEPAAGFEDAEGGVDCPLRVFRVVQGLAEDGEIQRLPIDRRILAIHARGMPSASRSKNIGITSRVSALYRFSLSTRSCSWTSGGCESSPIENPFVPS